MDLHMFLFVVILCFFLNQYLNTDCVQYFIAFCQLLANIKYADFIYSLPADKLTTFDWHIC